MKSAGAQLKRFDFSATLSIAFHLLLLYFPLQNATKDWSLDPAEAAPIEITQIPNSFPDISKKQMALPKTPKLDSAVVETEDAGNRDIDLKTNLLGENNQKVAKQIKSKIVDDFRNRTGTGHGTQQTDSNQQPSIENKVASKSTSSEDSLNVLPEVEKITGIKRSWKSLSMRDLSVVGSGGDTAASDDYVPGVQVSDRTVLSTREFKFFSYYNRIKELLRQYWKPTIQQKVDHMLRKGRSISGQEMLTSLQIIIDSNGNLAKVSKLHSSGYNELDDAAIEAFSKAAPFPNPPKQLMETDGFARIRWDFILTLEASPVIQFQNPNDHMRY